MMRRPIILNIKIFIPDTSVANIVCLNDHFNSYSNAEDVVKPYKFHKILLKKIEEGAMAEDISVSRPAQRVHWGIPVPGDSEQRVYVWLDALVNYLTAVGYPHNNCMVWPPTTQVVGKDIIKFHGIYWPAFLIAAGLEPPKSLLVHSHWTVNGEKMSKTAGNVVNPFQQSEIFTPSGLRYVLLREGTPHSDGNYNDVKAVRYLNADLASTLGNLLSRCTGRIVNANQVFPAFSMEDYLEFCRKTSLDLEQKLSTLADDLTKYYNDLNFYRGITLILDVLYDLDRFFETMKPWELCKQTTPESKRQLNCILTVSMETLRVCAIGLLPIVPRLATTILDKLQVLNSERNWNNMDACFIVNSTSRHNTSTDLSKENIILYKRIAVQK